MIACFLVFPSLRDSFKRHPIHPRASAPESICCVRIARGNRRNVEMFLFAQIASVPACYECSRYQVLFGDKLIIECENNLELSVQSCIEGLGISLLSDWDVLAFVHRHGVSLTSADQIACLIGYESAVVGGVLDRLEREKLIERSRPSQGVRFYRILTPTDAGRRRCLQQLVSLSESRAGRLLLTKRLKPVPSEIRARTTIG